MQINKDLFDCVVLLNKYKVEYLVTGGYDVPIHSYPSFTFENKLNILVHNEGINLINIDIN